jgi:hypothetical protein
MKGRLSHLSTLTVISSSGKPPELAFPIDNELPDPKIAKLNLQALGKLLA